MFKVVTDQLKVSQGWVRCGQCAEVFEAPEHMQPAANTAAEGTDAVTPPPAATPTLPPMPPSSTLAVQPGGTTLPNPEVNAYPPASVDAAPHDLPASPVIEPSVDASWAPARSFADLHRILPRRHVALSDRPVTNADFDPERWQQAHQARLQQQAQAQASGGQGSPPSLTNPGLSRSPLLPLSGGTLPVTAPPEVRPLLLAPDAPRPAPPILRPLFPLAGSAAEPFAVSVPVARPYGFKKAKKSTSTSISTSTFDPFAAPDPRDVWHASPAAPALQPPSELDSELGDVPEVHEVSFVRQAQRQAFWRRPVMRALSGLVLLLLGAVLALQWGVHNRDALAARSPQWSAWVTAACVPLQCSVRALRNIEQVVIDSSGFNQLAPNVYQLSVTLKNHSPVAVQIPALEVTLTDTADRPVLRRVVMPAEFAPSPRMPPTLAASGELQGLVHITLVAAPKRAEANSETPAPPGSWPVVGYRLLAFYPE